MTSTSAAVAVLESLRRDLQTGLGPRTALRRAHRACDRLPTTDRTTPLLLLSWLAALHRKGRDVAQALDDVMVILTVLDADE